MAHDEQHEKNEDAADQEGHSVLHLSP